MLPVLRILGFLPLVLAAKIRREERRLIYWFRARGALDSDRAVTVHPDGAVAGWVHQRLIGAGALRKAGERYYLEEGSYQIFRDRRRARAWTILACVLVLLVIAFVTGVISS